MIQYLYNYPNTFNNGKIYHIARNNGEAFWSSNYKSSAMRAIRRMCAMNPGCLFILINTRRQLHTYNYIDGKLSIKRSN